MLMPNGKIITKCILCISYICAGNDSGKLPDMTELVETQVVCDAHLPESGIR
jgi:hypothetical protein